MSAYILQPACYAPPGKPGRVFIKESSYMHIFYFPKVGNHCNIFNVLYIVLVLFIAVLFIILTR